MQSPQYIPIEQAARAFGVPSRRLRYLAETGDLPEAKRIADNWLVPYEKLPAIATREEFVLDLHAATRTESNNDVDQYLSENVAAHTAIVLAKTRACAAKSETRQSVQKARFLQHQIDKKIQENLYTERYIEELNTYVDQLENDQAKLLAKLDQTSARLSDTTASNAALTARCQSLITERDNLLVSMDWVSRRRYQNRQQFQATKARAHLGHSLRNQQDST